MKPLLLFTYLLIQTSQIWSIQPAYAEDVVSERKAIRESKNEWFDAKKLYRNKLQQYFTDAMNFEKAKEDVTRLENEINQIEKTLESKKISSDVEKIATQNVNQLKSELDKAKKTVSFLGTKVQPEIRQKIEQELSAAATTASDNIKLLKKDTRARKLIDADINSKGEVVIWTKYLMEVDARAEARKSFLKNNSSVPKEFKKYISNSPPPSPSPTISALETKNLKDVTEEISNLEEKKKNEEIELQKKAKLKLDEMDCDKAKMLVVAKLLKNPKNKNIFGKMIRAAELKMAYRIGKNKNDHFESFVKATGIQSQFNSKLKEDESFKNQLNSIYSKYGISGDLEKIEILQKNFRYEKKELRLNNVSASAIILYLSQNEKVNESGMKFNMEDAAAIWAQERIFSNKKLGSADGNMLNFSTRICKMVRGRACGGSGVNALNLESIQKEIEQSSQFIENAIQEAAAESIKQNEKCYQQCEKDEQKLGTASINEIKQKIAEFAGKGSLKAHDGSMIQIDSVDSAAQGFVLNLKEVSAP